METLYKAALLRWGAALPEPLKRLKDRSDEGVVKALDAVLSDIFSDSWPDDSKIAWALLQGR